MKFPFRPLPGERTLRPVVDISFPELPNITIPALVDSGALGTRISDEIADALALDLSDAEPSTFGVGGREYECRTLITPLSVGRDTRPCEISFVSGWRHDHALLGIRGFFENYIVRIDATSATTTLQQRRYLPPPST